LVFIGIDPHRETVFSRLDTRVLEGEFLSQNDNGAMIGKRCAEVLGIKLGDTLTLIGMGYHGESANGLFPVTGIIQAFDPLLDERVVYTSLAAMQQFISMPDGVSTVSVLLNNPKKIDKTMARLQEVTDQQISCLHWKTLVEGTMAGASENKKQMIVYFYFLYVIVGFGLLGMVVMLTSERKKEFGVMAALGTKKRIIIGSLFWEMMWVSFIGIFAGLAFSIPITAYYHYYPVKMTGEMADALLSFGLEPVMPFAFTLNMFVTQAIIVFTMVLIVSLYPMLSIRRMKTIDALRG
jgi:ABC-type lipoprotein release transport system permease subunit